MDCSDGQDESSNCTHSCSNVQCLEHQFCQKSPDGVGLCHCDDGYTMINGTCSDINECEDLSHPPCSQVRKTFQFYDMF